MIPPPRKLSLLALTAVLVLTLAPAPSAAQDDGLLPHHHAWARFRAGAWKRVRATTESFDAAGNVVSTSVTDTTTTLVSSADDQIMLRVETTVEVAGKRFDARTVELKQHLCGAVPEQRLEVKPAGMATLTIDGDKYVCKVVETTTRNPTRMTVTTSKTYFTDRVVPNVLRTESVTTGADDKPVSQTTISAQSLDMPHRVLEEVKPTTMFKAVYVAGSHRTTSWAASAADVPGEVIWKVSKELDAQQRLVRRTTLELVDYGIEEPTVRAGGRLRRRAARRSRRNER